VIIHVSYSDVYCIAFILVNLVDFFHGFTRVLYVLKGIC